MKMVARRSRLSHRVSTRSQHRIWCRSRNKKNFKIEDNSENQYY